MAIKRTIGRSKFVQPSGIVVDSGGQAMAQASQNIANAITSITKNVDQNQLETAMMHKAMLVWFPNLYQLWI